MNPPRDETIDALLRQQFGGPVPDDGFSERVMQRLPSRRRRTAWPLWTSVLAGAAGCWSSLQLSPWLVAGWRDWMHGELSAPAITLLLAMAGMSLAAAWWVVTEAGDR